MAPSLSAQEDTNRRMLRARDEMDRRYAEPLDVPTLAAIAHLSPSQFGRVFKGVYGETPHRYLQRRRVERAMTLLRQTDRARHRRRVGRRLREPRHLQPDLQQHRRRLTDRVPGRAPAGRRAFLLHRGVDAPRAAAETALSEKRTGVEAR